MKSKRRVSSIDIGSNTALLLIAEYDGTSRLIPIAHAQAFPRLGKGMDTQGNLNPENMEKALTVLDEFGKTIRQHEAEQPFLTATSAVRDATNRADFLQQVRERHAWEIELLSGDQEAERTFLGAHSGLNIASPSLTIDIGGGSTELIFAENGQIQKAQSFQIGCVRHTERFGLQHPTKEKIQQAQSDIRKIILPFVDEVQSTATQPKELLGVAGTVTSLAAIDLGLDEFKPKRIHGYKIQKYAVKSWIRLFKQESHQTIKAKYPRILEGRDDIFLAGLLILEEIMKSFSKDTCRVSVGGIREGSLLHHLNPATKR